MNLLCSRAFLFSLLLALFSINPTLAAKPINLKGGGQLALVTLLTAETGTLQGIAEGNETLTYSIIITNGSNKNKTTSVSETVPLGTTYAGGDDFGRVCTTGDAAGTICLLSNVAIPGKSTVTLSFTVIVDDPVTVASVDNSVIASAVDCTSSSNDCGESILSAGIGTSTGFRTVGTKNWNEASVRRVLHTFAYAGLMSDEQIGIWAVMPPEAAIAEMLTFNYTNEFLSPSQDASSLHTSSLESLQNFWGNAADTTNPMRWDKKYLYSTLRTNNNTGLLYFDQGNLQRTWTQAVNVRGVNPFLHKVAFYLTNYQMAIRVNLAGRGLFRSYYDQITADLQSAMPFTSLIANASKSAATSRRYKHQRNIYNNTTETFFGNDDFAREYFQLFFRYVGKNEDFAYHEGVNIENNAKLLTGMQIDYEPNAYGSENTNDWYVAPINFTDHIDLNGRNLRNVTFHHTECLEIFHQQVCGATAAEKIDALSAIVSMSPEVMEALPTYIIGYFADNRITNDKRTKIAAAWAKSNDNLLSFLRDYAISDTFHSETRVKYRNTFDRNLTLQNTVVLDNEEAFIGRQNYDLPLTAMSNEGGLVFLPEHDVFGGQIGLEAANNPNVFKNAYDFASLYPTSRLGRTALSYFIDETQTDKAVWDKNWGSVAPTNSSDQYVVGDVANWLWKRVIGDGGKNFDIVARAQVLALLARGHDFGYSVTVLDSSISTDPTTVYSSSDLTSDPKLIEVMNTLAAQTMQLASPNITTTRRTANRRVSYAANFIAALPYTFAMEGK